MVNYLFVLKNEKTRLYRQIASIFIGFNIIASTWIAVSRPFSITGFLFYLLLPFLICLFLFYRSRFINKNEKAAQTIGLMIISLPWIWLGLYLVAFAVILFSVFYSISQRSLQVSVSNEMISYPSFPKKNIGWNELRNMVLKDGLLTIDLVNNRLIQQEVEEFNSPDEKEFNEFCRSQLNK